MQVLNLTRLPRASKIRYFPDRLLEKFPLKRVLPWRGQHRSHRDPRSSASASNQIDFCKVPCPSCSKRAFVYERDARASSAGTTSPAVSFWPIAGGDDRVLSKFICPSCSKRAFMYERDARAGSACTTSLAGSFWGATRNEWLGCFGLLGVMERVVPGCI